MFTGSYEIRDGRLVRTPRADFLEQRRKEAVPKKRLGMPAQDVADEKHLSRSKPYPNKGQIPGGARRRLLAQTEAK